MGQTGSGKTTIINLLMRFYDPQPGMIKIDGVDIRDFDIKTYRGKIALVPQDGYLFNTSLRKNLLYGLPEGTVDDSSLSEILKRAQLYDLVLDLPERLDTVIGERGVQLSGGEKQRVSIARAMLKKAEILLLDEATSSLDSVTEVKIQRALEELIKEKTSIVIAHRLSTVKTADRIIVLEEGKISEEGTMQELIDAKGSFYYYWKHQRF